MFSILIKPAFLCGACLAPAILIGQTAADYRAAVDEAARQYRGDFPSGMTIRVWDSYFVSSSERELRPNPFCGELLPLEGIVDPKNFCSTLVSLQRVAPNHTCEPAVLLRHAYDVDLGGCQVPYFRLRLPEPGLRF